MWKFIWVLWLFFFVCKACLRNSFSNSRVQWIEKYIQFFIQYCIQGELVNCETIIKAHNTDVWVIMSWLALKKRSLLLEHGSWTIWIGEQKKKRWRWRYKRCSALPHQPSTMTFPSLWIKYSLSKVWTRPASMNISSLAKSFKMYKPCTPLWVSDLY